MVAVAESKTDRAVGMEWDPNKDVSGIILNEPNEVYHAHSAVSKTKLDTFRESPELYNAIYREKRVEGPSGPALSFGTAGHIFLLEGEEAFRERYLIQPKEGLGRGSNDAKRRCEAFAMEACELGRLSMSACEEFCELVFSKKLDDAQKARVEDILDSFSISFENRVKVERIRQSVTANPRAAAILEASLREVTFRTPLLKLGYRTQCRADMYCPDGYEGQKDGRRSVAADLKTISSLDRVEGHLKDFGYYRAGPFYTSVMNVVLPESPVLGFEFVFVEKVEPYRCKVIEIDAPSWERGMSEVLADMSALGRCIRGELDWAAAELPDRVVGLPPWYLNRPDDRWDFLS